MKTCAVICRKVTFRVTASPFRFPMPFSPSSRAQKCHFCVRKGNFSQVFGLFEHKIGVFVRLTLRGACAIVDCSRDDPAEDAPTWVAAGDTRRKCAAEGERPEVRGSHKNKRGGPGWVGPPQILLYPEPGSNRHSLNGHWCLRPARLPIPPSGPAVDWSAKVIKISCWQKFYSGYGFFLPQASNTTS